MGTRSLTHFMEDRGPGKKPQAICTVYRQMDGYPTGMGAELKEILQGSVVVNGYGSNTPEKAHNGMGCLAATVIKNLKEGIGSIYVCRSGSKDCGEEYVYRISAGPDGRVMLEVLFGYRRKKQLWFGLIDCFDPEACESMRKKS